MTKCLVSRSRSWRNRLLLITVTIFFVVTLLSAGRNAERKVNRMASRVLQGSDLMRYALSTLQKDEENVVSDQMPMMDEGPPIERGNVQFSDRAKLYDLDYIHCGPKYTAFIEKAGKNVKEILLLHGATYTKEDWYTSKILPNLCTDSLLSVTAIDLDSSADGQRLLSAFAGLTKGGIISGKPLTVVTPSSSGYAMVNLSKLAEEKKKTSWKSDSILSQVAQGWVPIACYAVVKSRTSINEFKYADIPILAIYGSEDSTGKDEAVRLQQAAAAKVMQLGSQHACYFDEPDEFVNALKSFVIEL